MTREHKLALIIGFTLILVVGVLISDHLSIARNTRFASVQQDDESGVLALTETIDPLQQWIKENASREIAMAARTDSVNGAGQASDSTRTGGQPGILSSPTELLNETGSLAKDSDSVRDATLGLDRNHEPVVIAQGRLNSSPDLTGNMAGDMGGDLGNLGKSLRQAGGTIQQDSSGRPVLTIGSRPAANDGKSTPAFPSVDPKDVKTYRIQEKDSLYAIAKSHYGDPSLWEKLAAYNEGRVGKNGTVRIGATIRIPPKAVLTGAQVAVPERAAAVPTPTPTKVAAPTPAKPVSMTSYTVVKGDSLSKIAARQLGSGARMSEILAANKGVIDDPDDIRVGMVLKIPPKQ